MRASYARGGNLPVHVNRLLPIYDMTISIHIYMPIDV